MIPRASTVTLSPMNKKTILRLIPIIVIGFIVGFLLQGWMRHKTLTLTDPPPLVDQSPAIAQHFSADQLKGFCCPAKGKHCYEEKEDVICLRAGGYVFTYDSGSCEKICAPKIP